MSDGQSQFNERLRQAVHGVEAPPFLEARVRNQLSISQGGRVWLRFAAAAACCLAVFVAYQLGYSRLVGDSREAYIAEVSDQVVAIMRVGLGDHIHCTVQRKLPGDAPAVNQLAATMPREFQALLPAVAAHVPGDFRLMQAHTCRYHLRKFVHLSLRKDSSLASIVITEKQGGESFQSANLSAVLQSSGIPVYHSAVAPFQIAAFESGRYLVYVVSNLEGDSNAQMVAALAPAVRDFLRPL